MRPTVLELVVVAVVFGLLFAVGIANAQPATGSRPMVVDGVQGVWYPLETSQRLVAEATVDLPALQRELSLLEEKLALKVETIVLLRQNVALTEQQAEHWRKSLNAALSRRERRPGLFGTPSFTFVVGFISAGLFAVAMVYGLDQAQAETP